MANIQVDVNALMRLLAVASKRYLMTRPRLGKTFWAKPLRVNVFSINLTKL